MDDPEFLRFASDATLLGLAGAAVLLLALIAMLGERQRQRRKAIDAVGWVPWTTLFLVCFFAGTIMFALAVMGWIKG